ncbi:MAG TPA: hypothetical protein VJU17_05765 [Gemmatimonadales bacterium]|nr:hypothetical protein [Gemmatimonadales bacterium]
MFCFNARLYISVAVFVSAAAPSAAQDPADTGFKSMQSRGRAVMGVDQHSSTHRFEDLPDGGRIELQRNRPDSAGVQVIREHLRTVASAFAKGDFTAPVLVHAGEVPGARTMAEKHRAIRYQYRPLPLGGEVRISTGDAEALQAIHTFLDFQRREHRAGP